MPAGAAAVARPRLLPPCACGGTCPRCAGTQPAHRPQQDDGLERAADRFAQGALPVLAGLGASTRRAGPDDAVLSPPVVDALRAHVGFDFSGVRLHDGAHSAQTSAALGARAYTVGHDIHLGASVRSLAGPTALGLLAHELGHVEQQARLGTRLQRSPFGQPLPQAVPGGTTATPVAPAGSVSGGVAAQTLPAAPPKAGTATFGATTFRPHNPIDRLVAGLPAGYTDAAINGQTTPPRNQLAQLQTMITPTLVSTSPGLIQGQVSCRFDPSFALDMTTIVDELEAPTATGWHSRALPAKVGVTGCRGTSLVPVTLNGKPTDSAYQQLVHASEMEHVAELKVLHQRHFVPYHAFVTGLSASAGNAGDCEKQLKQRLGQRPDQAAIGFTLGDLAATLRYDDPASTHHGKLTPAAGASCTSGVTLIASQDHPPIPAAGPGNVQTVAPKRTVVDPTALTFTGTDLLSAGSVIHSFASKANATSAMGVLATLGVTEIQSFGPLDLLLAGAQAASGTLNGIGTHAIDANQYQVAAGVPNFSDWTISQVEGTQIYMIANFGAKRDTAYSAYDQMRALGISQRHWIGSDAAPDWLFQTA